MKFPQKIVAIVDDDDLMLGAIARLLRAHGFAVRTYSSAEAFLDGDAAQQAACLVLDIGLKGISGIELRRHLVGAGNLLPVIFITAIDSARVYEKAMEAGCVAYLRKPFSSAELVEAIAEAAA